MALAYLASNPIEGLSEENRKRILNNKAYSNLREQIKKKFNDDSFNTAVFVYFMQQVARNLENNVEDEFDFDDEFDAAVAVVSKVVSAPAEALTPEPQAKKESKKEADRVVAIQAEIAKKRKEIAELDTKIEAANKEIEQYAKARTEVVNKGATAITVKLTNTPASGITPDQAERIGNRIADRASTSSEAPSVNDMSADIQAEAKITKARAMARAFECRRLAAQIHTEVAQLDAATAIVNKHLVGLRLERSTVAVQLEVLAAKLVQIAEREEEKAATGEIPEAPVLYGDAAVESASVRAAAGFYERAGHPAKTTNPLGAEQAVAAQIAAQTAPKPGFSAGRRDEDELDEKGQSSFKPTLPRPSAAG